MAYPNGYNNYYGGGNYYGNMANATPPPEMNSGNYQTPSIGSLTSSYGAPPSRPVQEMNRGFPGKVIESMEEIKIADVPNDGSIGVFVFKDLSAIVLKQWNNKGTVDDAIYTRYQPPKDEQKSGEASVDFTPIYERLERIEQAIKKNSYRKPYKPHKQSEGGAN